jgi:hypothetical protein
MRAYNLYIIELLKYAVLQLISEIVALLTQRIKKERFMKAKFGMSLFINIVWLIVGGIISFWIGTNQTPWMIVGILIMVVGITGINLAFID